MRLTLVLQAKGNEDDEFWQEKLRLIGDPFLETSLWIKARRSLGRWCQSIGIFCMVKFTVCQYYYMCVWTALEKVAGYTKSQIVLVFRHCKTIRNKQGILWNYCAFLEINWQAVTRAKDRDIFVNNILSKLAVSLPCKVHLLDWFVFLTIINFNILLKQIAWKVQI